MSNNEIARIVAQCMCAVANSAKDSEKDPVYIDYKEAKRISGLSRWKVYGLIKEGKIVAKKVGKSKNAPVLILRSSFLAYIDSCEIQPKTASKTASEEVKS